jgi:hypothetical protein
VSADEVYRVIVEECGADEEQRVSFGFDRYWNEDGWKEWRFCGLLGFGGKVYRTNRGDVYVACYREDRTPDRDAMVARANERLAHA